MPDALRSALLSLDDPALHSAWTDLLAQSPQSTAFSHLAYGAAVERAFGLRPRVATVWDGDRLAGGALLFEKRRGPFRAAALPPFTPLVTPIFADEIRETDVHRRRSAFDALAGFIESSFDQAGLVLHPSLADARPLTWSGWTVAPAYTYRIDVAALDDVTNGWSGSARRLFQNEGDDFDIAEGDDQVDAAAALVEASHRRQAHGLGASSETFRAFLRDLAAAGLLQALVARRGGEPEAALFVLSDGRTAYYWLAGSVPGAGMTVLTGRVLARLREAGVAYFDLAGANVPSIAEFKRKFGGRLVPTFRARHVAHPLLRLADRLRP